MSSRTSTKLILDAVRRPHGDGPAWPGRPQARPQGGQVQSRREASRPDDQGGPLRVQHRSLITKRQENLTEEERDDLKRMLEYLPALATLRRFADRIYWVFDTPKDRHQASCRRSALVRDAAFLAIPELAKAMNQLDDEKFTKLMAYLNNPATRRVRTNNHVERTNRMFRFLEKVRYKWRGRRTLVRFVVLTLDGIWREWTATEPKRSERPNRASCGESQIQSGQQSSCAA